jgi:hypothetical protein
MSLLKRVGYFGFSLIVMVMVLLIPPGETADLDVVILSGPSGGTFEVVASAISEIIRKKVPGVMASPEPGRGGLNVKMVEAKKGEMGVDLNNKSYGTGFKVHQFDYIPCRFQSIDRAPAYDDGWNHSRNGTPHHTGLYYSSSIISAGSH